MSRRVWACRRACVPDCILQIMLAEGSLTGLGELFNWECATEHLWAHVLTHWCRDGVWRCWLCVCCSPAVALALTGYQCWVKLNPFGLAGDGPGWSKWCLQCAWRYLCARNTDKEWELL